MSIDLVIFDCDGVLVDSEALACVVHADALTTFGYAITADQVHDRFLGRSANEARVEVEAELGRALPDEYSLHLKAAIDRVFDAQLQAMPGLKRPCCESGKKSASHRAGRRPGFAQV